MKRVPTVAQRALSSETVEIQPLPRPQPSSIDLVTAGGYLLAAGAAILAIAPKIIEKYFAGVIAQKQSQNDLKTQITKTQAELELLEKQKELEAANNLSAFYLETAKDGQKTQVELLNLFVANKLNDAAQQRDQVYELIKLMKEESDRVGMLIIQVETLNKLQHDILNVLKMKERGSN
jgi:hypothetical protein